MKVSTKIKAGRRLALCGENVNEVLVRDKGRPKRRKAQTKVRAGAIDTSPGRIQHNETLLGGGGRAKNLKVQTKLKAGQEVPPSPFRLR
jgi:hypothetical protein